MRADQTAERSRQPCDAACSACAATPTSPQPHNPTAPLSCTARTQVARYQAMLAQQNAEMHCLQLQLRTIKFPVSGLAGDA